jgi:hypothetical protein
MAKKKTNYHVVPNSEHGWAVKKAGAERVSGFAPTQRGAEKLAKTFSSRSGGGEVVIHRRDGKIRDKDTVFPASDPFPPRDRKY